MFEADFLGAPDSEVVGVDCSRLFLDVERTLYPELFVAVMASRGVGKATLVLEAATLVFALAASIFVGVPVFEVTTPGPALACVPCPGAADRAAHVLRSRMIVSLNGHDAPEG